MNTCTAPPENCDLCPRLEEYRVQNRAAFPDKFNAPVPSFGPADAELLVVGLAPGLRGANFTGRPFTGDYAGDLLYATLSRYGLATGTYKARPDDGVELLNCRITNAVRCVPPENKPTGPEIKNCQPFLENELRLSNLKVILSLGKISHDAVVRSFGEKLSAYKFAHAAVHELPDGTVLIDSYHCSRYNTNTGRLTAQMFHDVFELITVRLLSPSSQAAL
jgi:uracil-DNA glycosylase family 4